MLHYQHGMEPSNYLSSVADFVLCIATLPVSVQDFTASISLCCTEVRWQSGTKLCNCFISGLCFCGEGLGVTSRLFSVCLQGRKLTVKNCSELKGGGGSCQLSTTHRMTHVRKGSYTLRSHVRVRELLPLTSS